MAALQEELAPEDSAELLGMMGEARRLDRREDETGWQRAKRDLVLEMLRHPLLIAVEGLEPATRPGPEGSLMVAFTDDEAAQAWSAEQHAAAPTAAFALSSRLSDHGGRRGWLNWFDELDAVAVVVNPSGPLGFVAHAHECRETRAPLRRRRARGSAERWLDRDARAAERRRVTELNAALHSALNDDADQRFDALRRQIPEQNRMGSMLWAAEGQAISGRWRLRQGQMQLGALQLVQAGVFFGRFADPYRAIDQLIGAGERLIALDDDGVDDPAHPGFVRAYLADVARLLPLLTTGYRASDIAPFARWRSDAPPGG